MLRFILLCLLSRVNSAATIQRHIYSHQISKISRTESPLVLKKPGLFDMFTNTHTEQSKYVIKDPINYKTAEKLGREMPIDTDILNFPRTITETYAGHGLTTMPHYDYNYKRPRNTDSLIRSSEYTSGLLMDRLKYPPSKFMNDVFYGYDGDFHNDEEDVRTSGRNMYDNYASFIYHNPYEYDQKNIDMEKAKDKRYADLSEKVIPVHEHINENDSFLTPAYEASTIPSDNPIGGNGPFFSFVLNDYFDRNHDEDTLSFKGLGSHWGKDFDHESYNPVEDTRRDRRLETYFTPVVEWITTPNPSVDGKSSFDQAVTENVQNMNKQNVGKKKFLTYQKSDGAGNRKYEGFKDFLDSFANKFGMEESKGDSNRMYEANKDKGENKKGFHRIYHKDEFLEDKEFFDRSNHSDKAADKAFSKYNLGGSEAILRSQAFGAENHAAKANNEFTNGVNDNYENRHTDDYNMLENNFNKYIHVAKQAARSNNADYLDHIKL